MRSLVLVDIQNDFLPGGALAVPEGDVIVPVVNRIMDAFKLIVATKDWHPANHASFAANHPGKNPGDVIELNGVEQILWPVHCVQDTPGAAFASGLNSLSILYIFRKGTDPGIDSYSGFYDNGHLRATGLADFLKMREVDEVFIAGLATDYCVKYTALDARRLGFRTWLIEDATRGVNLQRTDAAKAISEMKLAGVNVIRSDELLR